MTNAPSPLASPEPWDLVSAAYAEEVVPQFTLFAKDAWRLAALPRGARVLDVACGPGTLALLAAADGARVDAIDFSPKMVELLRAKVARDGIDGVDARVGDGQALPFADASYDGAFSMFGLMFFPDRARGFGELRRCLCDGGVAVVGSWQPMESSVPFLASVFEALRAHIPGLPFGNREAPLSDEDVFASELGAAGFRDIAVHAVTHSPEPLRTEEAWPMFVRTMAPLAMLSRKMGPAWPAVSERILGDLRARHGEGPQHIEMPAWIGVARK